MVQFDAGDHETTEVVICGGGPTGMMLSALLGEMDVPNVVLERDRAVATDPRGIALDEDGIRCVQSIGMYDRIYSKIAHCQKMLFISGDHGSLHRRPFLTSDFTTNNGNTGHAGFVFHKQPELEGALRDAASPWKSSDLRLGCTVQMVSEDADWVQVEYVDSEGRERKISARFLVGADGKTGYVRKKYLEPRGIQLQRCEGTNYDETWVALNWRITLPTPETHADFPLWKLGYSPEDVYNAFFPDGFRFLCNPGRPSVCGRFGLVSDRLWRFEFVLNRGEDGTYMATKEQVGKIVNPYITHPGTWYDLTEPIRFPEDCIETLRSRPFSFLARSCNKWALERIIIVGDAAHVFPPFGGQGIASGFRDASGLAWRLCHLHRSPDADYRRVLEGWYVERKQQLEHSLAATIRNGEFVTNGNFFKALFRDWMFWAIQLSPNCKRWLEQGPRPTLKYSPATDLPFLPTAGGGVNLPQVYARVLTGTSEKVTFTDDLIFRPGKKGLMQLLVLLDHVGDLDSAVRQIKDLSIPGRNLLLPQEATYLVHDFHAGNAGDLGGKGQCIARIASAQEFWDERSATRGVRPPPPLLYDCQRMRKDLRPGAKFVILRRDRYTYAACVDGKELGQALDSLASSLCL